MVVRVPRKRCGAAPAAQTAVVAIVAVAPVAIITFLDDSADNAIATYIAAAAGQAGIAIVAVAIVTFFARIQDAIAAAGATTSLGLSRLGTNAATGRATRVGKRASARRLAYTLHTVVNALGVGGTPERNPGVHATWRHHK